MTDQVDQEVQAIKVVLTALAPLSEKARASVLEYIARRLDMPPVRGTGDSAGGRQDSVIDTASRPDLTSGASMHIKDFKTQKNPRSANEMAAVVAYYLGNLAPPADRKKTINQKDIETYFKIAGFPLPQQMRVTLPNAKAAGYFDSAGEGEYRLNAVGYNLVAHAMPRGSASKAARTSVSRRKTTKRNASRRKKTR